MKLNERTIRLGLTIILGLLGAAFVVMPLQSLTLVTDYIFIIGIMMVIQAILSIRGCGIR